ncbi:velvet factor-domain-containing protein [Mycena alexandri]|uniref:Velvet factor-domain-containing protein n=1 Tax=Mycena alexandri TaxID=1745969 RepID=A0AAD6WWB4_9AGAR|nr:velvet factor-domain-containing protein [Mycena alexandri]
MSYHNFQYNTSDLPSQIFIPPSLQYVAAGFHDTQQSALQFGNGLLYTPIHFTEGPFAGKTVRATLEEIQGAVCGRKTVTVPREAKVDRRPLDPAPVAYLRLFEVSNIGTAGETQIELDYDVLDISGFTCTVDLLSVPRPESISLAAFEWPETLVEFPLHPTNNPEQIELVPDVTCDNVTTKLAGSTFVQVDNIPWMGRPACLLFTFSDLAVKAEGYFMLQYRFFDLFSTTSERPDPPIQAQCQGAPFRVYSTKDAPALSPSTELSKHLARYGVRLNVRETARKRKHHDGSPSPGLLYTTRRMCDKNMTDGDAEEDSD